MNKLVKKQTGVKPKTTFISKAKNGQRFSFSYNTGKKDNKGKIIYETREFNSRQEAEAFRKKSGKVGKITDRGNLGTTVLKADNSNSKSTAYRRQQEEGQYNSLTFKQAYNKARSLGKEAFGYKGKVYSTDLTNPSDRNMTAMKKMYGNYLGFQKDPKLQNKVSRAGRERQNKGMNVEKAPKITNDNTKKDNMSKVAQNFNAAGLVDALMPTNAVSNFIKMGADKLMGEHYTPETYASGFNPFGYVKDFNEGNYGNLGLRGLDAYLTLGAPGARVNITPRGTNVTSGADVLSDGSRVFSKWHLNSLGPTATQSNGILRNAKGTTYFIDNGQFMRDLSVPALIAAPLVQPASKKHGGSLNRIPFYQAGTPKNGIRVLYKDYPKTLGSVNLKEVRYPDGSIIQQNVTYKPNLNDTTIRVFGPKTKLLYEKSNYDIKNNNQRQIFDKKKRGFNLAWKQAGNQSIEPFIW